MITKLNVINYNESLDIRISFLLSLDHPNHAKEYPDRHHWSGPVYWGNILHILSAPSFQITKNIPIIPRTQLSYVILNFTPIFNHNWMYDHPERANLRFLRNWTHMHPHWYLCVDAIFCGEANVECSQNRQKIARKCISGKPKIMIVSLFYNLYDIQYLLYPYIRYIDII